LANPAAANSAAIGVAEVAGGNALGGASLATSAAVGSYYVRLLETDRGAVSILATTPKGASMEIAADMAIEGKRMVLSNLHIGESTGKGSSSLKELREVARVFGRQEGVDEALIKGGVRTTGANPGKRPIDILINVGGKKK
jgi:hypothetical protein